MHKKLTITLDANVYEALHRVIGRGNISQFIENLVRPHVCEVELETSYREQARDEASEREALEWTESVLSDVAEMLDEKR